MSCVSWERGWRGSCSFGQQCSDRHFCKHAGETSSQPDGISPTLVKTVIKAARDAGLHCSRAQAVWCLKRTNGQEGPATEMILAQKSAKRALEVLRDPSQLAAYTDQLGAVQGGQVRKVRAALRMDGIKELVEKLQAVEDEDDDEDEEPAGKDSGREESAAKKEAGVDDPSPTKKAPEVLDLEEEEEEEEEADFDDDEDQDEDEFDEDEDDFDEDEDDDYDEEEDDYDDEEDESERSGDESEKESSVDEEPRKTDKAAAPKGVGDLSRAEAWLLRWSLLVCDHYDKRKALEPQEQKVIMIERRIQSKVRELDKQLQEARNEIFERAKKVEVSMDLFPQDEPWVHFPWEKHFRPRSECEDRLRQAIGLRDLAKLDKLLDVSVSHGLSMRNSRIFFEALELRDLLKAQVVLDQPTASEPGSPTPQAAEPAAAGRAAGPTDLRDEKFKDLAKRSKAATMALGKERASVGTVAVARAEQDG